MIFVIGSHHLSKQPGGAILYQKNLAINLAKKHKVIYTTITKWKDIKSNNNLILHYYKPISYNKYLRICLNPFRYKLLVDKYKENIQLIHLLNFEDGGLIENDNIPKIYTIQGAMLRKNTINNINIHQKIFDKIFLKYMKKGVKTSSAIIFGGTGMDPEIRDFCDKYNKQIYLIPNGIDTEKFSPFIDGSKIRKQLKISDNDIVIISTCRFTYERRIDILLEIFKKITIKYNNIHLLLIGFGPEFNKIFQIIKNKKINKVHMLKYISNFQLPKYYAAADIAFNSFVGIPSADAKIYPNSILKSIQQVLPITTGLSTLEALSTGLPAFFLINKSNDDHWVPQNDCGFIFNCNNLSEALKKLEIIIEDASLRKKMGLNARAVILKERSIAQMIKKTEKIYRLVMD